MVQDPEDAEVPSKPENTLNAVQVDYSIFVDEISALLPKLVAEQVKEVKVPDMEENKKTGLEVRIATQDEALEQGMLKLGELSPYDCPECHGVLSVIKEGDIIRYRWHTGDAYSADSLLTSITGNIEDTLWSASGGLRKAFFCLTTWETIMLKRISPNLAPCILKKRARPKTGES